MNAPKHFLATGLLFTFLDQAVAADIETLGAAVGKALGATKGVLKKEISVEGESVTVFYLKDAQGKPSKFAVKASGLYEPNCQHTWVVGLDSQKKVDQVRVTEMSCHHAYPAKADSFLDQFKGKGPAEAKKLKDTVNTIAKATGSCDLTTAAVVRSIEAAVQVAGGK